MISDYVMTQRTAIAIAIICLASVPATAADLRPLSEQSVILVSADEAWEDTDQNAFHFRGNFRIHTPGWTITADVVTIFGALEEPQRLVADGSPVHIVYTRSESGKSYVTDGQGQHLEYVTEQNLLTLTGNAKLSTEGRVMQSSEIQYDLDRQRLDATGPEGVQITIEPRHSPDR